MEFMSDKKKEGLMDIKFHPTRRLSDGTEIRDYKRTPTLRTAKRILAGILISFVLYFLKLIFWN